MKMWMKNEDINITLHMDFATVLTFIFITLKLLGKIDWSWVWVLSPIWIPFVLVVIIFVIVCLVNLVWNLIDNVQEKQARRNRTQSRQQN